MQPCPTCGAVDIDVNGYCVNCRAFRGAIHHVPQPGYAAYSPVSGAPGAPQRRRAPLSLLLLTVTMLVAVTAVLAVVLVRNAGKKEPRASVSPTATSPAPAPSASASTLAPAAAGLDKCLVGTWVATTDYWPLTEDLSAVATSRGGPVFKFTTDAKMIVEFGSGVSYTGTLKGQKAEVLMTGTLKFDFTTASRVLNFTNPVSDVRMVYTLDNVVKSNAQQTFGPYTAAYSCDGDKLVVGAGEQYPSTMRRQ